MNCLIVTELFWPEGSGAELATYLYAKLLSQMGIKVTVLTGSFHSMKWRKNEFQIVPWVPGIKPKTKYSSLLLASCLVRNPYRTLIEQADIVYISKCCWAIPPVKSLGKPVVIGIHEYSPICPTAILYNYASKTVCENRNLLSCLKCIILHENEKVEKLESKFLSPLFNITLGQIYGKLLAETDAIVFVSNYQRDTITKLMPNISDKSYVIYNPIPSIEEEEDGVEGQDYGFYGGTSILKGFQILLEGLRLLDKHVKVHVAGRTDERFMVNNSQLTYHGWLNSSAYYELIKRTKVTIFPSISPEPCPYVILESMLYGKLVIASEIGAIPEITKGAPGVFLFPAGDSVSLSKRVEQIELMDRDTLLELGRKNRDLIRHRFRNDKTIEGLLRIIDRVVD